MASVTKLLRTETIVDNIILARPPRRPPWTARGNPSRSAAGRPPSAIPLIAAAGGLAVEVVPGPGMAAMGRIHPRLALCLLSSFSAISHRVVAPVALSGGCARSGECCGGLGSHPRRGTAWPSLPLQRGPILMQGRGASPADAP